MATYTTGRSEEARQRRASEHQEALRREVERVEREVELAARERVRSATGSSSPDAHALAIAVSKLDALTSGARLFGLTAPRE
jgi:hypothetical protein